MKDENLQYTNNSQVAPRLIVINECSYPHKKIDTFIRSVTIILLSNLTIQEGHIILVYDQELEKEVDLDTLIYQKGRIQRCIRLYFLLVCEPRFAELGLSSVTSRTSRRADKCHQNSVPSELTIFPISLDNSIRHNDAI